MRVTTYTTEPLRESDTVPLSGRRSALGNLGYWTGVRDNPDATAIRREFAELFPAVEKVVPD